MAKTDKLKVFGAAYGDVGDAMKDFAEMQSMHVEGGVGDYDAAIVTKEPSGQLILSNGDSSGHFRGASAGVVVGAVLGAVFPPSMIVAAALGAGAGAIAGGSKKFIGRGDIKSLGDLLKPGESGILLVSERVSDDAAAALMPRALRKKSVDVEGDAEAIKAAVRAAALPEQLGRLDSQA